MELPIATWEEIMAWFGEEPENHPKPDEILLAHYDIYCYSGEAHVIYRVGDKYFYVSGSHCSCYGLEDQWDPEEYTIDLLIGALDRMSSEFDSYRALLIDKLKERLTNEAEVRL